MLDVHLYLQDDAETVAETVVEVEVDLDEEDGQ